MKTTTILVTTALIALSACAKQPDKIVATAVSTSNYSYMSCNQLRAQRNAVVTNVNNLTTKQKKAADDDALIMGVGILLFWPAMFAPGITDDFGPQLAQAKGEYDAINAVGNQKRCKGFA